MIHDSRAKASLATVLFALALAQPASAQKAEKLPADPDVPVKLKELAEVAKDRKFTRDAAGIEIIDVLIQKQDKGLNDKDQKQVVKGLDSVLNKGRLRPAEKSQLYNTAAIALGRFGKDGAKPLKAAYEKKRFPNRPEWVPLREKLLVNIGKTKDESAVKFLLDEARRSPEAALQAARAVGYRGAGTVEFLWSGGEFFFLEMNTRLQVEHPITEQITGIDLVRQQLLAAAGEPLALKQEDLTIHGHSIEVRINAEDPTQGYLPSTGVLQNLRAPGGPWVRLDTGMYRGMEVGLAYDPMLGKLIVWAPERAQAIERMIRAIQEMNVGGVRTSLPAALTVLEHERFRRGNYDTHFLESLTITPPDQYLRITAAAAAIHRHLLAQRRALAPSTADRAGWRDRGRRQDAAVRAHADDHGVSRTGGQA